MSKYEIARHIEALFVKAEALREVIAQSDFDPNLETKDPKAYELFLLNQHIKLWIKYLNALRD